MGSSTPYPLALGRFKRLAVRSDETWQGGIVRMPMWVENPEDPDGDPFRPPAAFWVSLKTGFIHVELATGEASPEFALRVLLDFPAKVKGIDARPAAIQVSDPAVRDHLAATLDGTGTHLVLVGRLLAVEEALAAFEAAAAEGPRVPGLLEAPGMTIDRVRGFAQAAASFYVARPWRHLTNEDLVVVEAPGRRVPKGLKHVVLLGNGGHEYGLAFFSSRKAFERIFDTPGPAGFDRAHGVTFGPVDELPFADVDAWEAHALPAAGSAAYPLAAETTIGGEVRRPGSVELTFTEALLRAFADVTEDELDAGAWERRVPTADGEFTLRLTLPLLLEAESGAAIGLPRAAASGTAEQTLVQLRRWLDRQQMGSIDEANAALEAAVDGELFDQPADVVAGRPLTPLEQAQELVYEAEEATGRLRVKLARRALAIAPDCADAYRLLGDAASALDEASAFYARAVEAGARAIGDAAFASLAGGFWGHLETRPYMRARLALAGALRASGRMDDALGHYRELLRLNPGDNQGVRYLLLPFLLERRLDDEADRLLAEYEGDIQATWPYARALRTFRAEGASPAANAALADAVRVNPHVRTYLVAPDEMPMISPPHFALGSPEEAVCVAEELLTAYEDMPGAVAWLRSSPARAARPRARRGAKGSRRP
jgi:tetratricopeptide (TPR) repeat protein